MTRVEAYQTLRSYVKNQNLIRHCLAAEAAMKGICKYLLHAPDDETLLKWGLVGLLHDADYEIVSNPKDHGILITEKVKLPEDIAYAIKAHNYQNTKLMPQSQMDWAIACCDELTGLIVASALVSPGKKLTGIASEFVMKKFYDKDFAKGADRHSILLCEEKLGIFLLGFIEIVMAPMKEIAPVLGL